MAKESVTLTEAEKDLAIKALILLQEEIIKVGTKADGLGAKKSKSGAIEYAQAIEALKQKFL